MSIQLLYKTRTPHPESKMCRLQCFIVSVSRSVGAELKAPELNLGAEGFRAVLCLKVVEVSGFWRV